MMDLPESLAYLSSLSRFGWVLGLERIEALCERFGHPEKRLRALHVGGTKGKGSVAMMLSHVLHAAGLRVGTFVKPHLYDVRERVLVDLEPISGDDFAALMSEIRPAIEAVAEAGSGTPTEFEAKTLLMFLHFARVPMDVAVIEVGLGGTYDSTNVIDPMVSVITNVSLDHVERLGHTVPEIAEQKAGIIKPGRAVATAARDLEALAAIERKARECGSPLWRIGREFDAQRESYGEGVQRFSVRTPVREYRGLAIPLAGAFQVENAATAIAAVDLLAAEGALQRSADLTDCADWRRAYGKPSPPSPPRSSAKSARSADSSPVPEDAVRQGLSQVRIAGRMEILRRRGEHAGSPLLMIDAAHNAASAQALAQALQELYGGRKLILVIGVSEDHSAADVVAALAPLADRVIATAADNPRALPAERVAEEARRCTGNVESVTPVPQAVARALAIAGEEDVICVTGSFYVIGEVPRSRGCR